MGRCRTWVGRKYGCPRREGDVLNADSFTKCINSLDRDLCGAMAQFVRLVCVYSASAIPLLADRLSWRLVHGPSRFGETRVDGYHSINWRYRGTSHFQSHKDELVEHCRASASEPALS